MAGAKSSLQQRALAWRQPAAEMNSRSPSLTVSSSPSTPWPFLAEMATMGVLPPHSSAGTECQGKRGRNQHFAAPLHRRRCRGFGRRSSHHSFTAAPQACPQTSPWCLTTSAPWQLAHPCPGHQPALPRPPGMRLCSVSSCFTRSGLAPSLSICAGGRRAADREDAAQCSGLRS